MKKESRQQADGFERIREQYPPIITTSQVAELLDINARTVLMMAADGRLPASRFPGSRKFHFVLEDVLSTLRSHTVQPGDPVIEEVHAEEPVKVAAKSSGAAKTPKTSRVAGRPSTRGRRRG